MDWSAQTQSSSKTPWCNSCKVWIGNAARLILMLVICSSLAWSSVVSICKEPSRSISARRSEVSSAFDVPFAWLALAWPMLASPTLAWITPIWTYNSFRPCCTFSITWWYWSSMYPQMFLVVEHTMSPISSRSSFVRTNGVVLIDLSDLCFLQGPTELRF